MHFDQPRRRDFIDGRKLLAPELIEHVNDRITRYLWSCEACGHQFETSVYLAPPWHCYA